MILFMNSGVIADPALMLTAAVLFAVVAGSACGLANGLINHGRPIDGPSSRRSHDGIYRGLPPGFRKAARSPCASRKYRSSIAGLFRQHSRVPVPMRSSRGHCRRAFISIARVTPARGPPVAPTATWLAIPASPSIACAPSPSSPGTLRRRRPCCSTVRGSDPPRPRPVSLWELQAITPSSSAERRSRAAPPASGADLRCLHSRIGRKHQCSVELHQRIPDRRDARVRSSSSRCSSSARWYANRDQAGSRRSGHINQDLESLGGRACERD